MNKVLLIGGTVVGLLAAGGVAYAMSGPKVAGADSDPNRLALDALATGDPNRIDVVAVALSQNGATNQAAAIQRTGAYIRALQPPAITTEGAGMVVASIRTLNASTMRATAETIRRRGYQQQAVDLETVAKVVEWLQAGASAAAPESSLPQPNLTPTMTDAEKVAEIVRNGIASGDPVKMRQLAAVMRREGYPAAALQLEAAAGRLEGVPASSAPAPQVVAPSTAATAVNTAVVAASTPPAQSTAPSGSPERELAGQVAMAMRNVKKGKDEPRDLVSTFQIQERLTRQDGSYGSETALAVAKYGIVPPKPLYWGKKGGDYNTLVKDKNNYKLKILGYAASDPQRRDEWTAAAKV